MYLCGKSTLTTRPKDDCEKLLQKLNFLVELFWTDQVYKKLTKSHDYNRSLLKKAPTKNLVCYWYPHSLTTKQLGTKRV